MADDNVVKFYPKNAATEADNVIEQAVGAYADVVIIGWNVNGYLEVRANEGLANNRELLFILEKVKHKILSGDYEYTEDEMP